MTEITPSTLEPNLVPIEVEDLNIQEGMAIDGTPAANTPATPATDLNIKVSANGSVMSIGNLQSTNFHAGSAGWRLDSNGNIEANDGNFRGDITGATGTFTGTVSIGSLNIPDEVTADSFHVDTTGNAWWGSTAIGSAVAKIEKDGSALFTSITATGTINAQDGYLSAGVYIDAADGIVCESGGFDVGVSGHIRGGSTDYNTGAGWWIGYDTTAYKLSIGDPDGDYFRWTGTAIESSYKLTQFIGGSGSDGDVTINDGGTTTLTADMYYDNLTITNNSTLNPAGYRIFWRKVLTIDSGSTIARNGNNGGNGTAGNNAVASSGTNLGGAGGSAGAALTGNYLDGGEDGKAGGTGGNSVSATAAYAGAAGTAGDNKASNSLGSNGAVGATGGAGGTDTVDPYSGGAGGAAGAAGTVVAATQEPTYFLTAVDMLGKDGSYAFYQFLNSAGSGSAGGGGGGGCSAYYYGASGGGGGGSGSTGGIILLCGNKIVNNGSVSVIGGNGGNGAKGGDDAGNNALAAGGGGGAGSGGNGGIIVLVCSTKSGSGTYPITAGTAGVAGAKGITTGPGSTEAVAGSNGNAGTVGKNYLLYG